MLPKSAVKMESDETANSREVSQPKVREFRGGILRLDSSKLRRSSGEFNSHLSQADLPTSPLPSVDRLSVTFADDSLKSDSSKCNLFNPNKMDKVHFPEGTDQESDDEDYSASVSAIMQRRASSRKSKRRNSRRASSPFTPDILPGVENGRRRSSVYTTSSGDTAITIDDSLNPEVTQEQIMENIKLHQEVLRNVKMQPWNMRKKIRLVTQAKNYIKRHEGILQEKLAQSRSTKDMLARWNLYLVQKWDRYRREVKNFSNWFIPWEKKIKEIESHFGSVVASYFTFLRWLFWVNMVIVVVLLAFVTVPEMLTADPKAAGDRKLILAEDKYNATNFLTLWDFEGVFKYSPIFYGWYTNLDEKKKGYRLPVAYFVTGLVVYAYSFFAILRRMAMNSRMSKLSEKDDECVFTWKLFTGWDYMIGNAETAHNRVASIVMGLKAALLEEAEKKRAAQSWKIIGSRILVNIGIIGLLSFSVYAVVLVVNRSKEPESTSTVWRRNEITLVMGLISVIFPTIFEIIGLVEHYHPRAQLRLQLARIMVLYLLNLYSLIFALFGKITEMTEDLQKLRPNVTNITEDIKTALTTTERIEFYSHTDISECYKACTFIPSDMVAASHIITAILTNISTTTLLPKLVKSLSTDTDQNFTETTIAENSTYPFFNETVDDYNTDDDVAEYESFYLGLNNISSTDLNVTDVYLNTTDWRTITREILKSTVPPWSNFSSERTDETDFGDILDEITTAINNIQENDTSWTKQCLMNCDSLMENETTTQLPPTSTTTPVAKNNYASKSKLRSLCWETMFGQELVKLTIMDMILTIISTLGVDFLRGIFVRLMNNCWCWDLEKKFPQYGDFKVAENILHLVNNQGMVWMGMFFAPGLVLMNVIKLYLMMYFRTWTVLTCNVPHKIIFRASKSNNFYFGLLLLMLFLCVLPVGYAIVWLEPSWHCGPFSEYHRIFHIFTKTVRQASPKWLHGPLDYIASPGIVIPLLVLLILIIYYLVSLTSALREANNDLKIQLRRERTEERRKMFQMAIADRRRRVGSSGSADLAHTPFDKWKKLLNDLPYGKSIDETPKESQETDDGAPKEQNGGGSKSKDFFSKLIKLALRKSSETEIQNNEDLTDTEQNDSLPEDRALKAPPPTTATAEDATNTVKTKRDAFKDENLKHRKAELPEPTKEDASLWSENIPTITISKTESAECILEKPSEQKPPNEPVPTCSKKPDVFKPKVKYALRKQETEVDIDSISFISTEIVQKFEGTVDDAVSAEERDRKPSQVKAVHEESVKTESSGDYKDSTLS